MIVCSVSSMLSCRVMEMLLLTVTEGEEETRRMFLLLYGVSYCQGMLLF